MTKTAATPSPQEILPASTSCGDVIVDLAVANAGQDETFSPPSVIKLLPKGKIRTRDERAYEFDPAALVACFDAYAIEVPIDLEHGLSVFAGDRTAGAIGRVSKLEARADGLYGHVAWLEGGLKALKACPYRYI